ncbi:hypothetical protein EV182_008818, partial [Spiromyces aspiralis]
NGARSSLGTGGARHRYRIYRFCSSSCDQKEVVYHHGNLLDLCAAAAAATEKRPADAARPNSTAARKIGMNGPGFS